METRSRDYAGGLNKCRGENVGGQVGWQEEDGEEEEHGGCQVCRRSRVFIAERNPGRAQVARPRNSRKFPQGRKR